MNTTSQPQWHHQDSATVVTSLQTNEQTGLDNAEVVQRLARYGLNVVTMKRGHGPLIRFLLQFHQPLVYVLLVATVITILVKEYADAAVIFGVVLVNAIVGFLQEARALKAIEALAQTLTTEATVIRDGRKTRVPSAKLVPGDIVLLQSGDKVPADLRMIRCRDLQVAEAALTGESVPVQKSLATLPMTTVLADRKNMAYASTLVTYGQGTGVVVETGDHTEVGRISKLITTADDLKTPLTRKIAEFSHMLLVAILGLAALNLLLGWFRGFNLHDTFLASVALAVAAIPEGLPAAVTITLALGVARMASQRAIIRKLPAVETLGSTTVICSDKTGTLTENQMTVTSIITGGEQLLVTGVGYDPQGEIRTVTTKKEASKFDNQLPTTQLSVSDLHGHVALLGCLRAGLLCNDSVLMKEEDRWTIQGDPTEGALLVVGVKAGLEAHVLREQLPRIDTLPFESQHQYMATLHDQGYGNPRLIYLKGSVEAILRRCETALDPAGHAHPLDRESILRDVDEMASQGLRVLAFAQGHLHAEATVVDHKEVASGMTFLGLQGMIDPPRAEAREAIKACQNAGIQVKMITGDHALTAAAIARQLGLGGRADGPQSLVRTISGQELTQLSDEKLLEVVDQTAVFARVAPEQKLRLVKALQSRGHIAAMTGDGVNDAPALKQADIGVAMGMSGTDVAREASDMVLTDDNFASIKAAVEEGRSVFDNLTKFITWTLPTNGGEGLLVLTAVLTGTTLPLSPIQILWINMTTAVMLGLMLAFEPKEPGIMDRPPRNPRSPILTRPLLMRVGLVSLLLLFGSYGLFHWMLDYRNAEVEEARTGAVNLFVMGELCYLFNCRSLKLSMFALGVFSNRWILVGTTSMILSQLLFTYAPFMNAVFHSRPIGLDAWAAICAVSVMIYIIVEIEKKLVGYQLQGELLTPDAKTDSEELAGS